MQKAVLAAGMIATALLFALPASAEPSILGPTGLIVNPTADITQEEHAWIALNFFDNDDNTIWTANVTGALSENFEAGLGVIHPDEGDDAITFFGKWLFLPEEEYIPGAAVGLTVTDIAEIQTTYAYLVASKFIYLGSEASESASVHGGINYIWREDNERFEWFAGMDLELLQDLFIIVEWQNDDDDSAIFNELTYGARYYFDLHTTGQVALINGDLHIGASYVF